MAFNGSWNTTMKTPMGDRSGKLTLAQDGTTLSGTMESDGNNAEISNATVSGDTATWDVSVTTPMPITLNFTAQLDGDNISGQVKLGAFGSATFSGTPA
ncbi:MAG: hypothetical protein ACPH4G_08735 [Henriciella sp.]